MYNPYWDGSEEYSVTVDEVVTKAYHQWKQMRRDLLESRFELSPEEIELKNKSYEERRKREQEAKVKAEDERIQGILSMPLAEFAAQKGIHLHSKNDPAITIAELITKTFGILYGAEPICYYALMAIVPAEVILVSEKMYTAWYYGRYDNSREARLRVHAWKPQEGWHDHNQLHFVDGLLYLRDPGHANVLQNLFWDKGSEPLLYAVNKPPHLKVGYREPGTFMDEFSKPNKHLNVKKMSFN